MISLRHSSLLFGSALALAACAAAQQPSVTMQAPALMGSRPIEKQTETSVVRDYLQAWQTIRTALETNQPGALDASFVGTAHDKLAATILAQGKAGIHTRYRDTAHDLQFVFYSTEGQSIELIDTVHYEQQIFSSAKGVSGTLPAQQMTARYIVVLTPSDTQWRVRIFQGAALPDTAH